jgi:hypothetical protein
MLPPTALLWLHRRPDGSRRRSVNADTLELFGVLRTRLCHGSLDMCNSYKCSISSEIGMWSRSQVQLSGLGGWIDRSRKTGRNVTLRGLVSQLFSRNIRSKLLTKSTPTHYAGWGIGNSGDTVQDSTLLRYEWIPHSLDLGVLSIDHQSPISNSRLWMSLATSLQPL